MVLWGAEAEETQVLWQSEKFMKMEKFQKLYPTDPTQKKLNQKPKTQNKTHFIATLALTNTEPTSQYAQHPDSWRNGHQLWLGGSTERWHTTSGACPGPPPSTWPTWRPVGGAGRPRRQLRRCCPPCRKRAGPEKYGVPSTDWRRVKAIALIELPGFKVVQSGLTLSWGFGGSTVGYFRSMRFRWRGNGRRAEDGTGME